MENQKKFIDIFKIVSFGIIVSIFITLISIFIFALILYYTNASEKIIESGIIFISSVSILFGSILALKKIKEKGIFYGGFLGIIYMIFIYVISSIIVNDFSIGLSSILMIIFGIISGIIGGIIGVNIKN